MKVNANANIHVTCRQTVHRHVTKHVSAQSAVWPHLQPRYQISTVSYTFRLSRCSCNRQLLS